ncbi:FAD:protein FMN transferase [Nocardioides sp.]|uniref:FAD:protein FMN transferase n=1 Tax=Nocardioides sp. TaxID=35761 RepID=UPI002627EAD8|nr:FAD:protein FMN transferase [Nocardioides sp.]
MSTATRAWRDWSCSVSVTVAGSEAQAERAAAITRELMGRVDAAVSRFRPDSELERVNDRPGVVVPVGALTLHLVTVALDAALDTRGAVDPTLGSALIAAGYDDQIETVRARGGAALPAEAAAPADTSAEAPGPSSQNWRRVRVDPTWRRVGVPEGVRLDLGATAKAWTADEAVRRIQRRLDVPVLVAIGGDLAAAGTPASGDWRVDVAETEAALGTDRAERIGLNRGGLATSSTLARRWGAPGAEAHHLIDPRTGRPAVGGLRTASVWAPTALSANVMSTWLLVDPAGALDRLPRSGFSARLVGTDGEISRVGAWPRAEQEAA